MEFLLLILPLCALCVVIGLKIFTFNKTTYHKNTKNSYFQTINDLGKNGEYQIYKHLKFLEAKGGRFLFNVYLPKKNGETTELDIVLITKKGIVVFESKNYSGWIFGNEKSKTWTQILPQGKGKSRKEHFFNPIMQNKLHISCLNTLLDNAYPIYSVIAFSERCTLKDITLYSKEIEVVKRNDICDAVGRILNPISTPAMDDNDVEKIYEKLYPYSQVNEADKQEHIKNIKEKH